nr:SDR family NAD(P)-dependent oxidoreductase [Micromonospora sp. DSM 115978]
MNLQGRSAIVTGGAGGLGSATVRRLVAAGMHVAVFDQDADRAAELAKELGDHASAVSGDVNDDDDVQSAIAAAQSGGPLSLLVNVAGGGVGGGRTVGRDGNPHEKSSFVKTMEMNAFGTFNVARLSAAVMAGNEPDEFGQRGVIVNTASIAGIEGQTGQLAYGAAKAAILGMT